MKRSRKYLEKRDKFGTGNNPVDASTAIAKVKEVAHAWESVDLNIRLGINTRKADQNIRGTTILPKGTGKTPRVLVLCKEDKAAEANDAGADFVGLADMIDKIKEGWLEFDTVIATPDVMKDVSQVAKVLGPRGLMPNPKTGTVTADVKSAIEESKAGKVEYRADKTGIVHSSIGRVSFSEEDLKANIDHFVNVVMRAKPTSIKGQYVKSIYLSATQTPSIRLDPGSFAAAV